MNTTPARCQCGHGPSRHFHVDGSTSCRICTTCRSFRPRCTATVHHGLWPAQCSRNAVGQGLCRQHGGQA